MILRRLAPGILCAFLFLLAAPPTRLQRSTSGVLGATSALTAPNQVAAPAASSLPPGPVQASRSALVFPPRSANALVVRAENAQPGTATWQIRNYAAAGEIQAYAGNTSINAGDALEFYVSTRLSGMKYRIDFYRMGWYGGAGGRLVSSVNGLTGQSQGYYVGGAGPVGCRSCRFDPTTGLLDADWLPSYRLDVPPAWLSGVYLALLTEAAGKQTYVPFVVRQDSRPSQLLFQASFNTYEAYNAWGGKSLYSYNSTGARTAGGSPGAVKVSFNRPFESDYGSGQFLRYEYNLVRWLERSGYDVSYATDKDTDVVGSTLLQHRGFISAGHNEYWTAAQRRNVEQALAQGVSLAFLSGNAIYWQARYEPSASGRPQRTLVVYRGSSDPLFASDPAHATVRWQDAPLNSPASLLTGTLYSGQTDPFTQDWVVKNTNSWLFAGTNLKPGDRVPGLIGKEFDRSDPGDASPFGLQVLAHSTVTMPTSGGRPPDVSVAESTVYTAPSGAAVFSAGTVTWSWGLDDAAFPLGPLHKTPVSAAIQRLTSNLLDSIAYGPPAPP